MIETRPGLHAGRLINLMKAAIRRCQLDLSGLTVLTEAASGAYVVTPVLAAMAGAEKVFAVTRPTRYGTVEEIHAATMELARLAGVDDHLVLLTEKTRDVVAQADIVTNSGHVRPIDIDTIAAMKPGAVIPLMYEAWEFRPEDLDLDACRQAGVKVGGTTERHLQIDVFSYLGLMAIRMLIDARIAAYDSSILLLCNNPFRPFLEQGLRAAGARVDSVDRLPARGGQIYDAIVVSLTPGPEPVLTAADIDRISQLWPDATVAQFWGDVDRAACAAASVRVWPLEAPKPGHMGILLSDLGPEPIVRLQAGGLKAAEVLWREAAGQPGVDLSYVEPLESSGFLWAESDGGKETGLESYEIVNGGIR